MPTKQAIAERLRDEYNSGLSVYVYDNFVRLTNGSAAMFVDIRPYEDRIRLGGERYGEKIEKSCDPTLGDLVRTLGHTI